MDKHKQAAADQLEQLQELTIDNVVLGRVIGRGACGKILHGTWEGASCAVKELHSIFQEIASEEEFLAFQTAFVEECRRSIRLRHPNIVQFFGVYFPPLSDRLLPRLVMELLHCNLTKLLETNSEIAHGIKLSMLHDISLGIRFLHTSSPPIIHRDLSSNNVLISRGYVAKIGDLGTARFLQPHNQTQLSKVSQQLTKAPGTVDFMPPEVLFDNPQYGTPLDVFSFACVSLHAVTHQWPSPTAPVYTDPRTNMLQPRSEAERRSSFLDVFYNKALTLKPLLLDCLNNNPIARPSIVEVCKKLEVLRGLNYQAPLMNLNFLETASGNNISQLQLNSDKRPSPAIDYWESLEKVWQSCADLPEPKKVINVTQIGDKVYVTDRHRIFCHNLSEDSWSTLLPLPTHRYYSLASIVSTKQLLAIGGISQSGITNQTLVWDGAKRCWQDNIITTKMAIARYQATAIGYKSSVIVIGGRVDDKQSTTQSVEVLLTVPKDLGKSQWYTVQSIPFGTALPMTVVINDRLYVAGGYMLGGSVSHMTSASIPSLLGSNSRTVNVWSELTYLPCTTASFASYKDHLLVFGGDYVECIRGTKQIWKAISSIYLYHSQRKQWEVVGQIPYSYHLGRCINVTPSKIMFFGGLADPSTFSCLVRCQALTLTEQLTSKETSDSAKQSTCIQQ